MNNNKILMTIYSVYDKTGVEYGALFEAKNDAVATRQFKAMFGANPFKSDFVLTKHGKFDRISGKIEPLDIPAELPITWSPAEKEAE